MNGSSHVADLSQAARWLRAQNLKHARLWGLGQETRFDGDQDAGVLRLQFEASSSVDLPMQILGSFNPSERTFRWAWANASVDPALAKASNEARAWGEETSFAQLSQPSLAASFDELVRIVALAAEKSQCAGVYRGVLDGGLSVFMGFTSTPVARVWPETDPSLEAEAIALVTDWHRECFAFDRAYRDYSGDKDAKFDAIVDAKNTIYDRYWHRDDDYWRPCSVGWPSPHDSEGRIEMFALPRRAGGCFVVTRQTAFSPAAHAVERTAKGVRITDQDLNWSKALIWPMD